MTMRTWFLIAALAAAPLFTATSAQAQAGGPRHGMHHGGPAGRGGHDGRGRRLEMLTAILGLDAQQQASIRQIVQGNEPRRQQIRQLPDAAARHAAIRALHEETHAAIQALLTPDQRSTLARVEAARRAHHEGGRRGPGPSGPGAPGI